MTVNEENYDHLNKETKAVMILSLDDKVAWVRKDHFVSYPKAKKILRDLDWIITQPQKPYNDLDSITIIGETGVGKTSIVSKFKDLYMKSENNGDYEEHTVAHCVLPDAALGLKGLYISILKAEPFNYPVSEDRLRRRTTHQLEDACIDLLKKTNVRILFVDEIQHALGSKVQTTLNSLKRVLLLSGVPLVPVGTERTKEVLEMDDQLNDRCPVKSYSKLCLWEADDDFRRFLKGYESFLPFPEPSNLHSVQKAMKIFDLVKTNDEQTNLRRVSRLIKRIAINALYDNQPSITMDYIDEYEREYT